VRIFAVKNAVDSYRVSGLIEEDTVVADAEAQQTLELAAERLDAAHAGFGIAVNRLKNRHGGCPLDRPNVGGNVGVEADRLHEFF
jgi:hypothetical protein